MLEHRASEILTFLIFAVITGVGIYGSTQIYKAWSVKSSQAFVAKMRKRLRIGIHVVVQDFKLEWFIPDSSYVQLS